METTEPVVGPTDRVSLGRQRGQGTRTNPARTKARAASLKVADAGVAMAGPIQFKAHGREHEANPGGLDWQAWRFKLATRLTNTWT